LTALQVQVQQGHAEEELKELLDWEVQQQLLLPPTLKWISVGFVAVACH